MPRGATVAFAATVALVATAIVALLLQDGVLSNGVQEVPRLPASQHATHSAPSHAGESSADVSRQPIAGGVTAPSHDHEFLASVLELSKRVTEADFSADSLPDTIWRPLWLKRGNAQVNDASHLLKMANEQGVADTTRALLILYSGRAAGVGKKELEILLRLASGSDDTSLSVRLAATQALRYGCHSEAINAVARELVRNLSADSDSFNADDIEILRISLLDANLPVEELRTIGRLLREHGASDAAISGVWVALCRAGGSLAVDEVSQALRRGVLAARAGLSEIADPTATDAIANMAMDAAIVPTARARGDVIACLAALINIGTEHSLNAASSIAGVASSTWGSYTVRTALLEALGRFDRVEVLGAIFNEDFDSAFAGLVPHASAEASRAFVRYWKNRRMPPEVQARMRSELRGVIERLSPGAPTAPDALFLLTEWGSSEDAAFARTQAYRLRVGNLEGQINRLEITGRGGHPW